MLDRDQGGDPIVRPYALASEAYELDPLEFFKDTDYSLTQKRGYIEKFIEENGGIDSPTAKAIFSFLPENQLLEFSDPENPIRNAPVIGEAYSKYMQTLEIAQTLTPAPKTKPQPPAQQQTASGSEDLGDDLLVEEHHPSKPEPKADTTMLKRGLKIRYTNDQDRGIGEIIELTTDSDPEKRTVKISWPRAKLVTNTPVIRLGAIAEFQNPETKEWEKWENPSIQKTQKEPNRKPVESVVDAIITDRESGGRRMYTPRQLAERANLSRATIYDNLSKIQKELEKRGQAPIKIAGKSLVEPNYTISETGKQLGFTPFQDVLARLYTRGWYTQEITKRFGWSVEIIQKYRKEIETAVGLENKDGPWRDHLMGHQLIEKLSQHGYPIYTEKPSVSHRLEALKHHLTYQEFQVVKSTPYMTDNEIAAKLGIGPVNVRGIHNQVHKKLGLREQLRPGKRLVTRRAYMDKLEKLGLIPPDQSTEGVQRRLADHHNLTDKQWLLARMLAEGASEQATMNALHMNPAEIEFYKKLRKALARKFEISPDASQEELGNLLREKGVRQIPKTN